MNHMPASVDDCDDEEPTGVLSVGDPILGKSRLLSEQCSTCIFRAGNLMRLSDGRLHELVTQTRARESFIVCHDTLPGYHHPDALPAICRGFFDRYSTQALQIIERIFGFVEVDPPGRTSAGDNTDGGEPTFGATRTTTWAATASPSPGRTPMALL
jgi:hypothetical protein